MRLFPLSLSGAAFIWFISLPPNSVRTWADLEQKFHDYFFNGETELKLSALTRLSKRYMKVLLNILEDLEILETDAKDLADLAFAGLLDFHKEKLDG